MWSKRFQALILIILVCPLISGASLSLHHTAKQDERGVKYGASQRAAERERLMLEAEGKRYTVRRVEFLGNAHIRDQTLRRMMLLNEGDVFRKELLLESFRNMRRLSRVIRPVRLRDVEVRLDHEGRFVDMLIVFRETRRVRNSGVFY